SAGIETHGDTRVINTTLYRNDSDLGVGGIHNDGRLALVNSTLTGNSANIYSQGVAGGVANLGSAVAKNSAIAGNYARYDCPTSAFLCASDCSGGVCAPGGQNIPGRGGGGGGVGGAEQGESGGVGGVAVGDVFDARTQQVQPGVTLQEAVLADNGGPTPTVALLPASPARDAIPTSACMDEEGNFIATDQRGVPRPQGPACDIGA